jgi:adenosine deaminase
VKDMLENRMSMTICTDNRLVSDTTVTREWSLLTDTFEVPLRQIKDIAAYGFKKSFYPGAYIEKRNWAKSVMMHFDRVARAHGLS